MSRTPPAPVEGFDALTRYAALTPGLRGERLLVRAESQSTDYESGVALIGAERWRVRTARLTPTKPGAFVAVWRRDASGATTPFRGDDETAGLLVLIEEAHRFGAFRFTTPHLISLGVAGTDSQPGKRGFRVYPAWCSGLNSQASRSQAAQAPAFTDLTRMGPSDRPVRVEPGS